MRHTRWSAKQAMSMSLKCTTPSDPTKKKLTRGTERASERESMSAKSSDVVDSMIDDSLLGILIILLVLMLSTGYLYVQQLRQGGAQQQPPQRHGPNTNASLSSRTVSATAALASSSERALLSSTDFTDRQRRLHSQLPMRNGTRTVTISAAALFQTDTSKALSWTSDDVPALLSDLLHVADVYILCKVDDEKDTQHMLRVREWLTTHAALTNADTAGRGLQAHKVLICATSTGKSAFVRQIEPHVHVDGAVIGFHDVCGRQR